MSSVLDPYMALKPPHWAFSDEGVVVDFTLSEGMSAIAVGVTKPDKFGERHLVPQWLGPIDQPAEITCMDWDWMGASVQQFPWPLRVVGDDRWRMRLIVVREDASLYGVYYEIRYRVRNWWARFKKKCAYTYQIWS